MKNAQQTTIEFAQAGANDNLLPENGEGKLILCDINGTLFLPKLNHELLNFLIEAQHRGYTVLLHSNEPDSNRSIIEIEKLRRHDFRKFIESIEFVKYLDGQPDEPIDRKNFDQMAKAFLLIDDENGCGAGYSPSKAQIFWNITDKANKPNTVIQAWQKSSTLSSVPAVHPLPKKMPQLRASQG
jgi:hypothetical protein